MQVKVNGTQILRPSAYANKQETDTRLLTKLMEAELKQLEGSTFDSLSDADMLLLDKP